MPKVIHPLFYLKDRVIITSELYLLRGETGDGGGGGVSQKVLTVILIMGVIAKIVFKTLEERVSQAKTSKITNYC